MGLVKHLVPSFSCFKVDVFLSCCSVGYGCKMQSNNFQASTAALAEGTVDFDSLFDNIFRGTLSQDKNQREQAEEQLSTMAQSSPHTALKMFHYAIGPCPDASASPDAAFVVALRLAAATRLKNLVCRSSWSRTGYFTPEGKRELMALLIPALCRPDLDKRIAALLVLCLKSVVSYEWPTNWEELIPQVYITLDAALAASPSTEVEGTAQVRSIQAAALAIRICAQRAFGVTDGSVADSKLADALSEGALPRMCRILALVANYSQTPNVSACQHIALKAIFSLIEQQLPKTLCDPSTFDGFYGSLVTMTQKGQEHLGTIAEQAKQPQQGTTVTVISEDAVQRDPNLSPFFKMLKWLWNIHQRMIFEYQDIKSTEKRARAATKVFLGQYAEQVLQLALQLMQWHDGVVIAPNSGTKLATKAYMNAMDFLQGCVLSPPLKQAVMNVASTVLSQLIVPRLAVTAEDHELMRSDPEEYVRRQNSPSHDLMSTKRIGLSVVTDYLLLFEKERSPMLGQFLSLIAQRLAANESPVEVDAMMYFIAHLPKSLHNSCLPHDQMEPTLTRLIVPHLTSQHGFLRAKAVMVLARFVSIPWSNPQVLQQITTTVLGLLNDPELPVRMQAAASFKYFVAHADTRAVIEPNVVAIVQQYFQIMSLMDSESTIRTLNKVIKRYGNSLAVWAVDLCRLLIQRFATMQNTVARHRESGYDGVDLNTHSKEDDGLAIELNDSLGAMEELFFVLMTLVKAVPKDRGDIFVALQQELNGLFYAALSRSMHMGIDIDSVLELLTLLIGRSSQIDPGTWKLFPALHQVLLDGADDYLGELLAPIDNLISVDPMTFFGLAGENQAAPGQMPVYLGLLCEMIQRVISVHASRRLSERVLSSAVKAIDLIYLAARALLDGKQETAATATFIAQSVTPPLLNLTLQLLYERPKATNGLKVLLANNFLLGIAFEPTSALDVLEQKGAVQIFAQTYSGLARQKETTLRFFDHQVFLIAYVALLSAWCNRGGAPPTQSMTMDIMAEWLNDAVAYLNSMNNELQTRVKLYEKREARKQRGAGDPGGEEDDDEWEDDGASDSTDDSDEAVYGHGGDDDDDGVDWQEGEDDGDDGGDDDELWNHDFGDAGGDSSILKLAQAAAKTRKKLEAENADDFDDEPDDLLEDVDFTTPIDSENVADALYHALQATSTSCPQLWQRISSAANSAQSVLGQCSASFKAAAERNLL